MKTLHFNFNIESFIKILQRSCKGSQRINLCSKNLVISTTLTTLQRTISKIYKKNSNYIINIYTKHTIKHVNSNYYFYCFFENNLCNLCTFANLVISMERSAKVTFAVPLQNYKIPLQEVFYVNN